MLHTTHWEQYLQCIASHRGSTLRNYAPKGFYPCKHCMRSRSVCTPSGTDSAPSICAETAYTPGPPAPRWPSHRTLQYILPPTPLQQALTAVQTPATAMKAYTPAHEDPVYSELLPEVYRAFATLCTRVTPNGWSTAGHTRSRNASRRRN